MWGCSKEFVVEIHMRKEKKIALGIKKKKKHDPREVKKKKFRIDFDEDISV